MKRLNALLLFSVCSTGLAAQVGPQLAPADAIWFNGPIVTVDDNAPSAEAVAVKDGKIVGVGSKKDVMRLKGAGTKMMDLHGATLLPGFVDPHGHVSLVGFQALSANLLPPPDGGNGSVADIEKTLSTFRQK